MSKYIDLQKNLLVAITTKNTPNGKPPLTKEKACSLLNRAFRAFPAYVNSVLETASLEFSSSRYYFEPEDCKSWQELVMEKDKKRRISHETAVAAVTQLKRYCKQYDVEDVLNVDVEDRYAVADFCCEYVNDVFYSTAGTGSGKKYNMEEMCEKYIGDRKKYPEDVDISMS